MHRYKGSNNIKSIKAYEDFLELLKENGHELVSDYFNVNNKVLIDFKCGHAPHLVTPRSYKMGNRCPKCNGKCPEKAKEDFFRLIKENGHKVLSQYKNNSTKVLVDFCCGHEPSLITPEKYKNGRRCGKCSPTNAEEAKKRLYELVDKNGHKLLSEYKDKKTKVLIDFCCGHKPHKITPDNYKHGYGCPYCNASKGEKKIREVLDNMGVNFISQFSFKDLAYKQPLKFDFFIEESNMCIEYDGEQHFKPIRFFGSDEKNAIKKFKNVIKRDEMKNEYCKDNNIKLIRIPYWEFNNIENILKQELGLGKTI